ncbi:tRNA(His) guanylyltransferase Thg1 family protein (plasmid) [Clostridium perfringens]
MNSLGERMKVYESVTKGFLMKKNPVIVRLDGKAFHTFTKGLVKPFDEILASSMNETAKKLCEEIQCCKFAYTQSDEISLLLVDYDNIDTEAYFNNNIQKIVSVAASLCTLFFNNIFKEKVEELYDSAKDMDELNKLKNIYDRKLYKALFDARVFSLPKDEVCNYFIWRQEDAIRNSIQMVAQCNFKRNELHGKSCVMLKEMLSYQKDIDWDDFDIPKKRGIVVKKVPKLINESKIRNKWESDNAIPIFKENRDYIDDIVFCRI